MKKILILFIILFLVSCAKQPIYKASRSPSLSLTNVNIGTVANDGTGDPLRTFASKVNTNNDALETFAGTLYSAAETRTLTHDSLDAVRTAALTSTDYFNLKSDTNTYKKPMTYNGVINYVATHGGSGSGGFSGYKFIVGTTTGAPGNGDTTSLTKFSSLAGQHIEVYRGTTADLHLQNWNETATNEKTGYRYAVDGTVVVRPAWATGDRAIIKGYPLSSVNWYSFAGGGSTLLTSLRAYWAMDETTGMVLSDELGSYNGTTSGVASVTSVLGYSRQYTSSSSQYSDFGQTVGDLGTGDFSINFWFRAPSLPGDEQGLMGTAGIPSFYVTTSSTNTLLGVFNFSGTDLTFASNGAFSANAWYMITVTVARAGLATMYVNGTAQTDTEDISASSAVSLTTNAYYYIARSGIDYFNGYIDEAGIWTKVLSAGEVTELYNAGSGKSYPFN